MGKCRSWARGTMVIASASAVSVASFAAPASAVPRPDEVADWGSISPGGHCSQSHSWVASVEGLAGHVDTKLFESHSPPTPNAPESRGGGKDLVNLTFPTPWGGRVGIGAASALYSRSLGGKLPSNPGQTTDFIPAPCSAYAEAGGATVDVGLPYVSSPVPGHTQMSPLGVHVEGINIDATAKPGQPVALRGGAARGYLSSFGQRIINIPPLWPVNFGVRIPPDRTQPALATAITNEQVTTESNGRPTRGKDGHYKYDPDAESGYINGIHASVLGTNGADAIILHSAVLTKGMKAIQPTVPSAVPPVTPPSVPTDQASVQPERKTGR